MHTEPSTVCVIPLQVPLGAQDSGAVGTDPSLAAGALSPVSPAVSPRSNSKSNPRHYPVPCAATAGHVRASLNPKP